MDWKLMIMSFRVSWRCVYSRQTLKQATSPGFSFVLKHPSDLFSLILFGAVVQTDWVAEHLL